MVNIPTSSATPTTPHFPASSDSGGASGKLYRFDVEFGFDNDWSKLARHLSATPWYRGLHPDTRAAFNRACKKIATAFDEDRIDTPSEITPIQIDTWIATQTGNDTIGAGYHIVFGRLLRLARLQGQRPPNIDALYRLLGKHRPRSAHRAKKREG